MAAPFGHSCSATRAETPAALTDGITLKQRTCIIILPMIHCCLFFISPYLLNKQNGIFQHILRHLRCNFLKLLLRVHISLNGVSRFHYPHACMYNQFFTI